MSILIDKNTPIVVSGPGSPMVLNQCREMLARGTKLVGVVGLDTSKYDDLRHLETTFSAAVASSRAEAAVFFDDPFDIKASVLDAINAGLKTLVCLTEFVPVHDALALRAAATEAGALLIGPNSSGVLSPGRAKAGYFSDEICLPGNVGIITKGGSIAYGVISEMKAMGLGVSTIVSVGPDMVKGADYAALLSMFEADNETGSVLLLGEIGGRDEEAAAELIANSITKRVVVHVAGKYVKDARQIGHAGAIVRNGVGGYAEKVDALKAAGAIIAHDFKDIVPILLEASANNGGPQTEPRPSREAAR